MDFGLPRSTPRPPRVMPRMGKSLNPAERQQVVIQVEATTYRATANAWGLSIGSVQRIVEGEQRQRMRRAS